MTALAASFGLRNKSGTIVFWSQKGNWMGKRKVKGKGGPTHAPLHVRFWRFVSPEPTSGCWLWTGNVGGGGYGHIWDKKAVKAHRVSYEMHRGEIPQGVCVLHKCDNRVCVNPDHLFLGSFKDNTQDMLRKGRNGYETRRGPANRWTKLTPEQVEHIRRRELKLREYAALYGVAETTVHAIWSGKSWRKESGQSQNHIQ